MNGGREIQKGSSRFLRLLAVPENAGGSNVWIFNKYLLLGIRVVLAAVFLYAGLNKINNPLIFADEIKMYGILEDSAILYITAVILPWVEIVSGIAIVSGVLLRGGSFIISVLCLFFLVMVVHRTIGIMDAVGIPFSEVYFDCGCGFEPTYAWKKIIENSALLIISLTLFFSPNHGFVLFRYCRGSRG